MRILTALFSAVRPNPVFKLFSLVEFVSVPCTALGLGLTQTVIPVTRIRHQGDNHEGQIAVSVRRPGSAHRTRNGQRPGSSRHATGGMPCWSGPPDAGTRICVPMAWRQPALLREATQGEGSSSWSSGSFATAPARLPLSINASTTPDHLKACPTCSMPRPAQPRGHTVRSDRRELTIRALLALADPTFPSPRVAISERTPFLLLS